MTIKAVILIGGPTRGQRFRPLSFDSPKYMFPVGGQTILGHLIKSCLKLDELSEILLLGFYQQNETLSPTHLQKLVRTFMDRSSPGREQVPKIRYLQEFTRMGTAGGLYHFRDQIRQGNPEAILVINGDVCGDFDFDQMLKQHRERTARARQSNRLLPYITIMTTEASCMDSLNYGCVVENPENHVIEHYVEKPLTFISNLINCGAYLCSLKLLELLEESMKRKAQELEAASLSHDGRESSHQPNPYPDYLSLELDILQHRSSHPHCFSYRTQGSWWCQIKTAASAIYANKKYLEQSRKIRDEHQPEAEGGDRSRKCTIIGNVHIHPTAQVDASSVIGPNVSIMENCIIGPGVRVRDSIILQNVVINPHSLVLCAIVGWNCNIGTWVRVEGTPSEPDPNEKFAKVPNPPLFNPDGHLNPSISVLGRDVKISCGTVILNTIVLPHKELSRSYKNEIVL